MNFLNKWYRKNKNRVEIIFLFFFLGYIGTKSLDWISSKVLNKESLNSLGAIIDYKLTVPVSSIALGGLLTILVIKIWKVARIKRSKLKIISAKYGTNNNWVDITAELNDKVVNNQLEILISNEIAGDPLVGTRKVATVHYELNSKKDNKNVNEGEVLKLPE